MPRLPRALTLAGWEHSTKTGLMRVENSRGSASITTHSILVLWCPSSTPSECCGAGTLAPSVTLLLQYRTTQAGRHSGVLGRGTGAQVHTLSDTQHYTVAAVARSLT